MSPMRRSRFRRQRSEVCGAGSVWNPYGWELAGPLQIVRHDPVLLSPFERREPNNEKERAITIEGRCSKGDNCTYPAILPEVLNSVFLLSPTDTQFLVRHVRERCHSPARLQIVREPIQHPCAAIWAINVSRAFS